MSDLKDRILEEKLIVILRGVPEEKLIATVDILKNLENSQAKLKKNMDGNTQKNLIKNIKKVQTKRNG